jgi:O-antigen/teichoic acid export membrane protein
MSADRSREPHFARGFDPAPSGISLSIPQDDHIAHGVARGAALLIGARLATRLIDFAMLVVLGRLLSPVDFGLVAIAMTLVLIVEAIMEVPVSVVLLRASTVDKKRLDTAFTIGLLRGIAVASLVVALAWPLAHIYEDPRLFMLTCVLSIAPAFRGMQSPRMAAYAQKFSFSREFLVEIGAKSAAFIAAVSVALNTGSYWALPLGTVVAPFTMFVLSYLLAPYRPAFSLSAWREFAGVLGWNTASQSIAAVNWQWDQMVLGKFVSQSDLGHFTMANTLALLPVQVLVVQLLRPLTAAFGLLRGDRERLAKAYRISAQSVLAFAIPILVGISALSEPILRAILGRQWGDTGPILSVLALSVIPTMFIAGLQPMAMILDRTSVNLRVSLAEFTVKAPLSLAAAMMYGVNGVLTVRVVALAAVALYGMHQVYRLIGVSVASQIFATWRFILGAAVMAGVIWLIMPMEARLFEWRLLVWLICATGLSAAVYFVTVGLLWLISGRPQGVEEQVCRFVSTRLGALVRKQA